MTPGGPRPGVDRLLDDPLRWTGAPRVAVAANQASVTGDLRPSLDALTTAPDLRPVRLFAFEHGLSGFGEDAVAMPDGHDPRTGLPVVSLYGPRRRPDRASLADLDAVIVDVQEVGVRPYTYATTVALLLGAAADAGTRVVVCDRPGLIGPRIAGPPLDPAARSFLAYLDVPFQHGLTLGEAMRLFAARALGGDVDLRVVPVADGRRDAPLDRRAFVPPSPGLPSLDAVALYPGLVLLEGTNLSEGRGTPLPFGLIAAPWLDGHALADAVRALRPPGLWARPLDVRPDAGPYAGRILHGVQLHVTDPARIEAFEAGLALLRFVRERHPEFAWRDAASMPWSDHPDAGRPWHEPCAGPLIDGLTGGGEVRAVVEGRLDQAAALAAWCEAGDAFAALAGPHLLYAPPPRPARAA